MILPETFINSSYNKIHCKSIHIVSQPAFTDTDCPVVVALFDFMQRFDPIVYVDDKPVDALSNLKRFMVHPNPTRRVRFNATQGQHGLVAVDGHEVSN